MSENPRIAPTSELLLQLASLEVGGLEPRAWVCVGEGYSREEVKEVLLESAHGALTGEVVLDLSGLATRVLKACGEPATFKNIKLLGSATRQEVLARLLRSMARSESLAPQLTELLAMRRQRGIYELLDRALQRGRMAYSTSAELAAMDERARLVEGRSLLREQLLILGSVYDTWLEQKGVLDVPALLSRATAALESRPGPCQGLPPRVVRLSLAEPESREARFFEALAPHVEVLHWGRVVGAQPAGSLSVRRAHTLDDAADALAQAQVLERAQGRAPSVLIPDEPSVRRSLARGLKLRGQELHDPRDPTSLLGSEALKLSELPLRIASTDMDAAALLALLRLEGTALSEVSRLTRDAYRAGWTGGVERARELLGGSPLLGHVERQARQWLGKSRLEDWAIRHRRWLEDRVSEGRLQIELLKFWEDLWQGLSADAVLFEEKGRRAFARHWQERIRLRVEEATPWAPPTRFEGGVRLYRLSQAPLRGPDEPVWILGLEPQDFAHGDPRGGDLFWSARAREALEGAFAIAGPRARLERQRGLLARWCAAGAVFWDAQYGVSGQERDKLDDVLRELGADTVLAEALEVAWPRRRSYGAPRPAPPMQVRLAGGRRPAPLQASDPLPVITASELDHYSRCPFTALVRDRWKAQDLREASTEPWPEVAGSLLHDAVKRLVLSWDASVQAPRLAIRDALEQAWAGGRVQGLIFNPRMRRHLLARWSVFLERFIETERKYRERSGAQPDHRFMDDESLELRLQRAVVKGRPDRVDLTEHGYFVLDYKTGSSLPSGKEMVEQGYGLQLAAYALALEGRDGRDSAGLQFVQINRTGSRARGLFFKRFDGKTPGSLTQTTARSSSRLDREPAEVWGELRSQIETQVGELLEGRFDAAPRLSKREALCATCGVAPVCGYARLGLQEPEALDAEGGS